MFYLSSANVLIEFLRLRILYITEDVPHYCLEELTLSLTDYSYCSQSF